MYEKMRLDLEDLTTATQKSDWNSAADHAIARGMKAKERWSKDFSDISKQIIEIKTVANMHGLTNLQDKANATGEQMGVLHVCIDSTMTEIEAADRARNPHTDSKAKACPMMLPLLSGLTSKDFTGFKDKFLEMTLNTTIPNTQDPNREDDTNSANRTFGIDAQALFLST